MDINIGQKFNRLTILKYSHSKPYSKFYLCECECGNKKVIDLHNMRHGRTQSCGCLRAESLDGRHLITHGMFVKKKKTGKTPKIYTAWTMMRQRCYNKNYHAYPDYGGRGIKVCYEWHTFENFYKDMNNSMEEHIKKHGSMQTTLDRIDNNGNYEPDNCRWATRTEQSNNTRKNVIIIYDNQRFTLPLFCRKYKLSLSGTTSKLDRGWTPGQLVDKSNYWLISFMRSRANMVAKNNLKVKIIKKSIKKLSLLPIKHQAVMIYKFGLRDRAHRTLKETGVRFSLCEERVRQIEELSLNKLKKYA